MYIISRVYIHSRLMSVLVKPAQSVQKGPKDPAKNNMFEQDELARRRPVVPALTGLRFVAAGFVLISHSIVFLLPFPGEPPDWHLYLQSIALLGMSVFFVLSGFVIHYNYSEPIKHWRGVVGFFVARFARIYPLFFACISFDLAFNYFYAQLPNATAQVLPYYLILIHSWFYLPVGEHTIIYVFGVMPTLSWSISTEWFFYCMYPLIAIAVKRLQTTQRILLATVIVVFAAGAVISAAGLLKPFINTGAAKAFGPVAVGKTADSFYFWLLYFSPYFRLSEFLLGCLSAALFLRLKEKPVMRLERHVAVIVTAAATFGVLWLAWLYGVQFRALAPHTSFSRTADIVTSFGYCFGFAPLLAVIVFSCARYKSALASFLSGPRMILAGEASYSLYMLHLMVIYAFRYTVSPVSSVGVGIANAMMWLLTVATAVGLSIVSWNCFEEPARKWLRRAFYRTTPNGHPGAVS